METEGSCANALRLLSFDLSCGTRSSKTESTTHLGGFIINSFIVRIGFHVITSGLSNLKQPTAKERSTMALSQQDPTSPMLARIS